MTTHRYARRLPHAMVAAAALVLVSGCSSSSDEPDGPLDIDLNNEELEDAVADEVSEPELSYAEVTFLGSSMRFQAEDEFGCFMTEDGGSMGSVDFTGFSAAGDRVMVDWAGDSVDSAIVSVDLADGTEWTTPFVEGGVSAEISGDTAEVTAGLVSLTSGDDSEPFSATVVCP